MKCNRLGSLINSKHKKLILVCCQKTFVRCIVKAQQKSYFEDEYFRAFYSNDIWIRAFIQWMNKLSFSRSGKEEIWKEKSDIEQKYTENCGLFQKNQKQIRW